MERDDKAFDCVDMKNRVQQELMEEYRTRKADFRSYVDFINKTAHESKWICAVREKMREAARSNE